MFIHLKEDARWVALGVPPIEMSSLLISINNDSELASVNIKLTEIRSTILNKISRKCFSYDKGENFNDCYANQIWNSLEKEINCTLPGNKTKFFDFIF